MFRFGFDVNSNPIRAGIDKSRNVMIGLLDHKMHVQWQRCLFANESDDGRSERDVVDEMAIHDIAVDPVRAGSCDFLDFIAQT